MNRCENGQPKLFLAERIMDTVNVRIPNIPLITMTYKKFKGKI